MLCFDLAVLLCLFAASVLPGQQAGPMQLLGFF